MLKSSNPREIVPNKRSFRTVPKLFRDKPRVLEGNGIPWKQRRYHPLAIIAGRLAPEESPDKRLDVSRYMDQGNRGDIISSVGNRERERERDRGRSGQKVSIGGDLVLLRVPSVNPAVTAFLISRYFVAAGLRYLSSTQGPLPLSIFHFFIPPWRSNLCSSFETEN